MNTELNLFNNFTIGTKIYSVQKKSEHCYIVRENNKTLSIHTVEEEAVKRFSEMKIELKGGEKDMTAQEKFQEMGQKLKSEVAAEHAEKESKLEEAKNQLAQLQDNSELAKMYAESAKVGAENLGGQLPLLKVHSTGRSTSNELADGTEPQNGNFFYTPTQQEFSSINCHILTISRGFYTKSLEAGKKNVYNQVVGGVIIDDDDYKPFVMYFTGKKLQNMWDFGAEARKYTHAKPVALPMFTMLINLTTDKVKVSYGEKKEKETFVWLVKFDIVRENGFPVVILDPGKFQMLKNSVDLISDTIEGVISSQSKEEDIKVQPVANTLVEPTPSYAPARDDIAF